MKITYYSKLYVRRISIRQGLLHDVFVHINKRFDIRKSFNFYHSYGLAVMKQRKVLIIVQPGQTLAATGQLCVIIRINRTEHCIELLLWFG